MSVKKITECVSVSSSYTKLIIRRVIRTEFVKKGNNAGRIFSLLWKKVAREKGRSYDILKHEQHVTQVPNAFQDIRLSIFIRILTAHHRILCTKNCANMKSKETVYNGIKWQQIHHLYRDEKCIHESFRNLKGKHHVENLVSIGRKY